MGRMHSTRLVSKQIFPRDHYNHQALSAIWGWLSFQEIKHNSFHQGKLEFSYCFVIFFAGNLNLNRIMVGVVWLELTPKNSLENYLNEIIRINQMVGGGIMAQVAVTDWLFTLISAIKTTMPQSYAESNLRSYNKDMLLLLCFGKSWIVETFQVTRFTPISFQKTREKFLRVQTFTQALATNLERKKLPNIPMIGSNIYGMQEKTIC